MLLLRGLDRKINYLKPQDPTHSLVIDLLSNARKYPNRL